MDELFDPFAEYSFPSGSRFLNQSQQDNEKNVQNQQEITKQLCQVTDVEAQQLRDEIDSLEQTTTVISNIETHNRPSDSFKLKDPPDINEILKTEESIIVPTSHNVGVINAACQQVLKEIEQELLFLLKKNRKEQEIVQNYLSNNHKSNHESTKKANIKCVGMPYFKDLDGYPPPQNEDVLRKKQCQKLLPADIIDCSPIWSSTDAKNLVSAVKNLKSNSFDVETIDWMKISATDLDGKYSPSECKSKWMLNLSPSVNRSRWGLKEIKTLNTIAEKYNYQNWQKIAEELGTNRTDLQCCVQYQTHRAPNGGRWTKKEDETLKQLIEKYRVRDYIPWTKVVWFFERRSLRQCQERYGYHLDKVKKGGFTMEEDFVLVYLATKLKNFGEIAKFLPNRVPGQVRSRYEYLVKLSMPKFTKDEDELLTKLMILYPRNWAKISEFFKNRSKLQCRRRWSALQKDIHIDTDNISDSESDDQTRPNAQLSVTKSKKTNKEIMDAVNVNQNPRFLSRIVDTPKPTYKKCPEVYSKLLEYHKHCHKFLFGPKSRYRCCKEEQEELIKKMKVTMRNLSINLAAPLSTFNYGSLPGYSEFDDEDLELLTQMSNSESSEEASEIQISSKIIPPNYMTLVGLRTLTLGYRKIMNFCQYHKEVPRTGQNNTNRLLFTDAKRLFKARLKALFTLPLVLSNISQEGIGVEQVRKPKSRKVTKSLSKRKRREHAKMMSQAYRKKIQKDLDEQIDNLNEPQCVNVVKCDYPVPSAMTKRKYTRNKNGNEAGNSKDESSSVAVEVQNRSKRKRKQDGEEESQAVSQKKLKSD